MRFDDSLETVLSAETSTPFGAQSAWRQLVDLVGRRRVTATVEAIAELAALRPRIPPPVRAASARMLAQANPPAALVRLFADDEIAVAAPVLRVAVLGDEEWIALLPGMSPAARSILRHRRDLGDLVRRALDGFGTTDFRLASPETAFDHPAVFGTASVADSAVSPSAGAVPPPAVDRDTDDTTSDVMPPGAVPASPAQIASMDTLTVGVGPFVSVGSIALGLPVVAEARRRADSEALAAPAPVDPSFTADGPFEIADLVARLQAYEKHRDDMPGVPLVDRRDGQTASFDPDPVQAQSFRFETDTGGIVRWIEGAARAPLIGLSLDMAGVAGAIPNGGVDGVASGAFRRRAGFADARLVVTGSSDAAGSWRITASPVFDRASGRFTGYRGTARRPRADESAEPLRSSRSSGADALRQLVHELRTPTNAIAGFAEMIESQLLGPVPQAYKEQAGTIRSHAADLLVAIDDIDLAARLESHALDLRADHVPLAPLLTRIVGDLQPLATMRGTIMRIDRDMTDLAIAADERAVERLVGRLLSTLVASGAKGETIAVVASVSADRQLSIVFDRPAALAAFGNDAILSIDAEAIAEADGAPLLGTGFALRLARNLAIELGGSLVIGAHHLTLRLPAALPAVAEQASSS